MFGVLEQFGGIRAAEQVDGPVGENVRPVEVVAEFVEVDYFPDVASEQTGQVYSQDVDEGATLPKVHTLAHGTVAESGGD